MTVSAQKAASSRLAASNKQLFRKTNANKDAVNKTTEIKSVDTKDPSMGKALKETPMNAIS